MFAMYNPTAFGVGFVSFDVKFGEEARKFVKIRIPLCASETVVYVQKCCDSVVSTESTHTTEVY